VTFFGQRVRVHYNLTTCPPPGSGRTMKPGATCFVVKTNQGGRWLVADTVKSVLLEDVTFKVSDAGVDRIRSTRSRSVIAWLEGTAVDPNAAAVRKQTGNFDNWDEVSFNPFKARTFYLVDDRKPIHGADFVYCSGTKSVAKTTRSNPCGDLRVAGQEDLDLLAENLGGDVSY